MYRFYLLNLYSIYKYHTLEIHLSNIFSPRDEIVVDMQAATIQTEAARALSDNTFAYGDETLLKSVGIIRANASGKSNVFKVKNVR